MNKRKKLIAILSSAVVLVLVAYALFKPQKPYIAPADSDQMTATQAYEKSVITGSGAFGKISKEATPDINVSISNAS
ncbi:MAG: hypothetical protein LBN05_05135, partial [Oscillospiraceae bacterium]|nr:hypothetical protein [Oscillospiraceae bacterium]